MKIIVAALAATAALSLVLAPSAGATPTPEQICHELDVNPTENTVIGIIKREYTGVEAQDKALAEAFSKSFFVCPRNAELIITTLNDVSEQLSATRAHHCDATGSSVSEPGGSVITPVVNVWVPGVPKPQGSKRAYVHRGTGRAVIVEDNEKVRDWRTDVKIYVTEAMIGKDMIVQPAGVIVRMSFILYRPRSLPKTKPTPLATKKPDADKLARAVMDALTGVVYADDSQVIAPYPTKRIAEIGEQPGALIDVSKVEIR